MLSDVVRIAQNSIQFGNDENSNKEVQAHLVREIAECEPETQYITTGEVSHLVSVCGTSGPLLVYLGHSDVVSTGDDSLWDYPPFAGEVADGFLHGRGSVDMRSGNAAFCVALREMWKEIKDRVRVAIVIAGDEESTALGAPAILSHFAERGETIAACLVGEPSAIQSTGDRIRIGRRGSQTATFTFNGPLGHTAYVAREKNALHAAVSAANSLASHEWAKDPEPWPAVNFHVTNFTSGTGESAVVPPSASFRINIRYAPSLSREQIIARCEEIVASVVSDASISWSVEWRTGAQPYFTTPGPLTKVVDAAITRVVGKSPKVSVDGGTSDGRFFANAKIPTVEVGIPAIGLHAVNEKARVSDLEQLVTVYREILREFASNSHN